MGPLQFVIFYMLGLLLPTWVIATLRPSNGPACTSMALYFYGPVLPLAREREEREREWRERELEEREEREERERERRDRERERRDRERGDREREGGETQRDRHFHSRTSNMHCLSTKGMHSNLSICKTYKPCNCDTQRCK